MKKWFNFLKKLVFWTFFVGLFLLTITTVLLRIYEDDIEQYAIDEINKHLSAKVEVRDMEVTIIRSFPYASLNFEHLLIKDNYKNLKSEDTLIYAKDIYLNFNVWDLYNQDYEVKGIKMDDGVVKIKTTSTGDVNYNITKLDTTNTESNFKFDLNQLNTKNVRFEYKNIATNQFYYLHLYKANFEGHFSEEEYNLSCESDLKVNKLKSNSFALIKNKKAHLDLDLHINQLSNTYTFNKGNIFLEKMPFQLTGKIANQLINLNVKGNHIDINELMVTLFSQDEDINDRYKGEGELQFSAQINGPISQTEMPNITADFSITNGQLTELESQLSLTAINLNGHYNNEQAEAKEELNFSQFSVQLLNSHLHGQTKIVDFEHPQLIGKVAGDVQLKTMQSFFKFESIQSMLGQIDFNCEFAVHFNDIEYNPEQFNMGETKGDLSLKNVSFQLTDDPIAYHSINGDFVLFQNDAATKNLTVSTAQSDVLFDGAVKNIIPFIEGKSDLGIVASIESKRLDINEFLQSSNQSEETAATPFHLPEHIHLNLDLKVNELVWDTHLFQSISGNVILSEQLVKAPYFSLVTSGGTIAGNANFESTPSGSILEANLTASQLQADQLFKDWKNFDQSVVTDENIKGKLSGQFHLILAFDEYLSFLEDKLYMSSTIKLTDGQLNNVETMKSITDYMRENKALKLALNKHINQFEDKLLHLSFDDLNNQIEIKNRKIYIPQMLIKSNALDIEFSGWHDFDNFMEYHFNFRFRELKTDMEYTEFGKVEDDGLGWRIFLSMYGSVDNPEFKLDKDERKANLSEQMEQEKSDVKSILKTELGLFKKDSTVKTMDTKPKSEEVEFIYFENENEVDSSQTKNKKKSRPFFDKLKEQSEKEKKEEQEVFE